MVRLLLLLVGSLLAAEPVSYNRDVRPILSDRCFACHGPDSGNRKAGLRLDQFEAATAPNRAGKFAIKPSDPANSEILKRMRHTSKVLRMPPAYAGHDALPAPQIATIENWIQQGAKYEQHWAFQRVERPSLPQPNSSMSAIDQLVRQRLQIEGLTPANKANRETLLRRVTFDLTGLPPTAKEVDVFLRDKSADAFEKQVDRLLASDAYAERMAYRWMEVARYADTNGYQMDGVRSMWRWRDWVIDSFKRNQRFDQFTIEQLAGDLLPNATVDQKVATGFHRNHRTNSEGGIVPEEFRVEYVADRAETTSTVWLGLTLGCARCHDHKYDPLPQRDYYSMFAYFNSVPEQGWVYHWGNDEPMIAAPTADQQRELDIQQNHLKVAEKRWTDLQPALQQAQLTWQQTLPDNLSWTVNRGLLFRDTVGRREFSGTQFHSEPAPQVQFNYLDPLTFTAWITARSNRGAILSKGEDYFEGLGHYLYLLDGKLRLNITFRDQDIRLRVETVDPLQLHRRQHIAVSYDGSRYAKGVRMLVDGVPQKLKIVEDTLNWPMSSKEPLRIGAGGGLRFDGIIEDVRIYNRGLEDREISSLLFEGNLPQAVRSPGPSPAALLKLAFEERFAPEEFRTALQDLRQQQADWKKANASIPTVMILQDMPQPRPTFLLKRGAYDSPGEPVSPQVPSVFGKLPDGPPNRLTLARWIANRDNPLTARVTVNRFWQMLFGVGLVKTVEDFGLQGEWPANQALLDWLAVEFMESGWDVRHLLKTIVTSDTYQQSSFASPDLLQRDPDNRLLARGPRIRLSAEMIRDQALAASGLLVNKVGGPSVKPPQPAGLWQELQGGEGYKADSGENAHRRSLYTYWRRTVAPPNMITFDSPSRESCTVRESRTNTPLQALNLLNDPQYWEAARALAQRMWREDSKRPIDRGALLVLNRSLSDKERNSLHLAFKRFLDRYAKAPEEAELLLKQGDFTHDPKLSKAKLAALTTVASLLLNLDEAVNKP
jgi:hypothetical protein